MEKELHEQAVNLVQSIFEKCDPRLKAQTYANRDSVKLAMPDVFFQFFKQGVEELLKFNDRAAQKPSSHFRGIEIIPNHEMSIVLFHKEYPKIKEDWMIYKIWLETHKAHISLPDISGIS